MASRGTPRAVRVRRELVRIFATPFVMLFTESIGESGQGDNPSLGAPVLTYLTHSGMHHGVHGAGIRSR